ncbi:MAG: hypothetical protein ABJN40_05555 [Sneathiella sp.]
MAAVALFFGFTAADIYSMTLRQLDFWFEKAEKFQKLQREDLDNDN